MKRLQKVLWSIVLLLMPIHVFTQGSRMALVIGNSNYKNAGVLLNPVNDAVDISQALRNTGFEVIEYRDLDLVGMKRAIDQFGLKLIGKDIGLFYYAGHGIQANGINYLVPVDATINTENDVEYNCVDVGRMLAKMEDAGSQTNIVILDACRDNPFERSWSRSTKGSGLAFMNAPSGYLIAYATSPGTTASDGGGENGLYTSAILNHIYDEDISILQMFMRVRKDVKEISKDKQVPWESTSLTGDFYLNGPDVVVPASVPQGTTVPLILSTTAANNPEKSIAKPTGLTPEYFLTQISRISAGVPVFYNKFSSSTWFSGTIKEIRNNGYILVQYEDKKGKLKSELVSKSNVILSENKRMPADKSDINTNDVVYFFTNFDKIISYGQIISMDSEGVTVQSQYKDSESHTVPLSAILVQDNK